MIKKPTIKKGPASVYEGPGERIVEIWDPVNQQGCLLSIRSLPDTKTTLIAPYRADPGVVVALGNKWYKVAR